MKARLVTPLLLGALVLAAPAVAVAEPSIATSPVERKLADHPLVLGVGVEVIWGALHPGGFDLLHTLEVYDADPWAGLFNVNIVGEGLWRFGTHWEVGVHGGYNGVLSHGSTRRLISLTSQEVGPVARLVVARQPIDGGLFDTAFRFEGGAMRAELAINDERETWTTFFVRPALSLGASGGSGFDFSFGWTFALVPDGLGESALPLGGLDVSFIVRFEPTITRRAESEP